MGLRWIWGCKRAVQLPAECAELMHLRVQHLHEQVRSRGGRWRWLYTERCRTCRHRLQSRDGDHVAVSCCTGPRERSAAAGSVIKGILSPLSVTGVRVSLSVIEAANLSIPIRAPRRVLNPYPLSEAHVADALVGAHAGVVVGARRKL